MAHFAQERPIITRQITKRLEPIRSTIFSDARPIENWERSVTGKGTVARQLPQGGWEPYELGTKWGGHDNMHWFKAQITVPTEWVGKKVVANLNPGGEALAFLDGVPVQGLDPNRTEIVLIDAAEGGESWELTIEAQPDARFDTIREFGLAELAIRNDAAWDFSWDVKIAMTVVEQLPAESAERVRMLEAIDESIKKADIQALNHGDTDRFAASLNVASRALKKRLVEFPSAEIGRIHYAGHSHIDTAWLWPLRETMKKVGRTWTTVVKYMEEYPDYVFSASQAQLYDYCKNYYPETYDKIKQFVKEGRWEVTGASWIEQDNNVPSGEALVRQFLYGRRFFEREFGVDAKVSWVPDCFGFTFALPQIMSKSGVETFTTSKIWWSQYTDFPYSLFRWRGLDGTEILVSFLWGTYNASPSPGTSKSQWSAYKQKNINDTVLVSFGHGDGGGGPTKEHLENVRRLGSIAGIPKSEFGLVEPHAKYLHENVDWDKIPVYEDELYLELHRGCQTTQAKTKKNNRKSELLYRDAEMLGALAQESGGYQFPQENLYEGWKIILCNQFHDILPGSSINEVYKVTDEEYREVLEIGETVRQGALDHLVGGIDTSGEGQAMVLFNTLSWSRNDVATATVPGSLPNAAVKDQDGNLVPSQVVSTEGGHTEIVFEVNDLPPLGWAVYRVVESASDQPTIRHKPEISSRRLENRFFRLEIERGGVISRVYDKIAKREVIAEGAKANDLQLFDDIPFAHDAWDIDFNVDELPLKWDELDVAEVVEQGPVRATVKVSRRTKHSTVTQWISIYRNQPKVDFKTHVDWNETHVLMKAAFPVEVLSRKATYEIQFGAIERATHYSSAQDRARFEVAAHKWIDLSEGDYGVSLLNDCKYGFDTYQNRMRISLLRSPTDPDPEADKGEHWFTYSLCPHQGSWRDAETVRRGYELNVPVLAVAADSSPGQLPSSSGFACVDRLNVVIDTVKKAEDSDDLIVRLYEAHGGRGPVKLSFGQTPAAVREVNLMETDETEIALSGNDVEFHITPHEIRSFKVRFR